MPTCDKADNSKPWKWTIEPHPYDSQFDEMVTDSDEEARDAILHAAERHLWDSNDGETRTLKVTHNAAVSGGIPAQVASSTHYAATCSKCGKTTAWLDPRHEDEDVLCIHCGNLMEGANS